MRGRCPYCGARRGSSGKHATETNNLKGKVIIAALIAVVLIVAVVALLLANGKDDTDLITTPPGGNLPDEGDVSSVTSSPLPPEEPSPTETPTATPPPAITAVQVRYNGFLIANNDLTEYVGNSLPLTCTTVPAETDEIPVWESGNESAFQVVPDATGKKANLTVVGTGDATLTVTVGGVSAEVIIRCKSR
jgi:hypothetical protein